MEEPGDAVAWFVAGWPRVGLICAVMLAALLPALWAPGTEAVVLAASLLPVYMLHQMEEHGRGRFVAWFDATVGGGLPVLTARSACVINVVGVWALMLAALLLGRFAWPGWLLIPAWLALVNGLIHVFGALRERATNPGLATGALLFLPWGGFVAVALARRMPDAGVATGTAIAVAVAVHAAIVVFALRRRVALTRSGSRPGEAGRQES